MFLAKFKQSWSLIFKDQSSILQLISTTLNSKNKNEKDKKISTKLLSLSVYLLSFVSVFFSMPYLFLFIAQSLLGRDSR